MTKVRRVISRSLGLDIRHLSTAVIGSPRAVSEARAGRAHAKYVFELVGEAGDEWRRMAGDGKIEVFVKTGKNLVSSPDCLKSVASDDFYVPYLFGQFQVKDALFEVWEHVEGRSSKFARLERPLQIKLMRAIAGLNAVKCDGLPFKIRWLDHPFNWFERRCELLDAGRNGPWADILERISELHRRKDLIKVALGPETSSRLAHNDLKPGNVIMFADHVRIVDWEKATRSVPGADLRFLIGIKERGVLLDHYVARINELGVPLERDHVIRNFETIEGFRRIRAGCANGDVQNTVSGLCLVEANWLPKPAIHPAGRLSLAHSPVKNVKAFMTRLIQRKRLARHS